MPDYTYQLDLGPTETSIIAQLESEFPDYEIVPDGLLDDEDVPKVNGVIKPFITVTFLDLYRSPTGGSSFVDTRLDDYRSGCDLMFVAPGPTKCREMRNEANNKLIGWKPDNAGGMVKGSALWERALPVANGSQAPTRWSSTSRFDYGVLQTRS